MAGGLLVTERTGLLLFDKLADELNEEKQDYKRVARRFRLTSKETKRAAHDLENLKKILARRTK